MATEYSVVYKKLLSRIRRDEDWDILTEDEIYSDIQTIMDDAIPLFKFPREDLTSRDDDYEAFDIDLKKDTINVLADFMLVKWAERKSADTVTITQQYHTSDVQFYAQSPHLKATLAYCQALLSIAENSERIYYNSIENKSPLDTGLTGEI